VPSNVRQQARLRAVVLSAHWDLGASFPVALSSCLIRDRAILSVGQQVGLRRAEIAALRVGDLHQNREYDSLRVVRKGGRRDVLAIHPQTAQRIRAYLALAGHGEDLDGPLFRPLSRNRKMQESRRPMHPDAIDRVLRKHATAIGLDQSRAKN
jgi:integrase/recombinase XerD